MINKKYISLYIVLFSGVLQASDNIRFISLLGGDAGFIEAELCFSEKIDLSVNSDYSSATSNLKGFINGVKGNISIREYLKNKSKKLDLLLPVSSRFYKDQLNIKFKNAIFWGNYIGLGVQYFYPNNRSIRWREDFFCKNEYKECLIDFEFANDQNNQLYESIYYSLINKGSNLKLISAASGAGVTRIMLPPPFSENNGTSKCPLILNYDLVDLGQSFCLNCTDLDEQLKSIKDTSNEDVVNSIVTQVRAIQMKDKITSPEGTTIKIVGIDNRISIIGIEGYITYLSTWKKLRLLGFIKKSGQYYVFVEYNYEAGKAGNLEILRLKQSKETGLVMNLNDKISINENILYSRFFLDSVEKKYQFQDENNKNKLLNAI